MPRRGNWDEIPETLVDRLISGLLRTVEVVKAISGGNVGYWMHKPLILCHNTLAFVFSFSMIGINTIRKGVITVSTGIIQLKGAYF